jgi:hypothetical protein
METTEQLEQGFIVLRDELQKKYNHREGCTPFTGNLIVDFSKFTDDQSGKCSHDPNDPAAKYPPPSINPATGFSDHTIRDITWQTYHTIFPSRPPSMFFNMTDAERAICIEPFIQHGEYCSKDSINILCSYIAWGSWDYQPEISIYKEWYKSDAVTDAESQEHDVFVRLIDIRKYRYSVIQGHEHYQDGWVLGILNFYQLFKNYVK